MQNHDNGIPAPDDAACSPSIPPAAEGAGGAASRNALGQFAPGQSGNPAGKLAGTRNQITALRDNFEVAILDYANKPAQRDKALKAIDRMFTIMADGSDKEAVAAYKAMFGKITPDAKAPVTDASGDAPPSVTIIIKNHTDGVTIEGTATEVIDND